ncbi:hypothetical protein QE372_005196 [Agrobacterium pusense]|nr:hypothetical protein [Agrobacterium pusense]
MLHKHMYSIFHVRFYHFKRTPVSGQKFNMPSVAQAKIRLQGHLSKKLLFR